MPLRSGRCLWSLHANAFAQQKEKPNTFVWRETTGLLAYSLHATNLKLSLLNTTTRCVFRNVTSFTNTHRQPRPRDCSCSLTKVGWKSRFSRSLPSSCFGTTFCFHFKSPRLHVRLCCCCLLGLFLPAAAQIRLFVRKVSLSLFHKNSAGTTTQDQQTHNSSHSSTP